MDPLAAEDIALVRADNPGPFTLEGTNTWIVGRGPCWVIDPGPAIDAHVERVAAEAAQRGGLGGIALTHAHADHSAAVRPLQARCGEVEVAAMAFDGATLTLASGDSAGPFEAIATPGHSPDHLAYRSGGVLFSGDAVLGRGSVFVHPDPGALGGYLRALRGLLELPLTLICPGHGPLVTEPRAKIEEYLAHRLDRERRLREALDDGLRGADELLDRVWSDAPPALRGAAAVTLAAHLDKLADEGVLPAGVVRPQVAGLGGP